MYKNLKDLEDLIETTLENREHCQNAYSHGFTDGMIKALSTIYGRPLNYPEVEMYFDDEDDGENINTTCANGHILH